MTLILIIGSARVGRIASIFRAVKSRKKKQLNYAHVFSPLRFFSSHGDGPHVHRDTTAREAPTIKMLLLCWRGGHVTSRLIISATANGYDNGDVHNRSRDQPGGGPHPFSMMADDR